MCSNMLRNTSIRNVFLLDVKQLNSKGGMLARNHRTNKILPLNNVATSRLAVNFKVSEFQKMSNQGSKWLRGFGPKFLVTSQILKSVGNLLICAKNLLSRKWIFLWHLLVLATVAKV